MRLLIAPSEQNGLKAASRLMIDKVTTVPKARLGKRLGRLDDTDQQRVNRALMVFWDWLGRQRCAIELASSYHYEG